MRTSQLWLEHFKSNLAIERIDWQLLPSLTTSEKKNILSALQAWQLGETSDGAHLLKAAEKYAFSINDNYYYEAVQWFIKEEQKHGNNLGRYLDSIGEQRLKKNWADTLFRKVRYFNTSMEMWTLAVITVESTAQLFYQSLKDATACTLLQQICTDILTDEAFHIDFQLERFYQIYYDKSRLSKFLSYYLYKYFYFSTASIVWLTYRNCFRAGHNGFIQYRKKMQEKFSNTIGKLKRFEAQGLELKVES